jgi:hypothetical protein
MPFGDAVTHGVPASSCAAAANGNALTPSDSKAIRLKVVIGGLPRETDFGPARPKAGFADAKHLMQTPLLNAPLPLRGHGRGRQSPLARNAAKIHLIDGV